jgi:catechol 2,3-dioxygenase-like lactoylglutathione lyase family enzyme
VIDHLGMPVKDIARATEFYLKALAPLGIAIVMEVSAEETGAGAAVGFGANGKPFFWIGQGFRAGDQYIHIAFAAPSREAVDAFYAAAIAAGARDNGPPGLRPHYHANYYGAFVLDADGNNIEALCHAPTALK